MTQYLTSVTFQVQNTLFRLSLSVLHEHSPVLKNIVPPIASGSLPVIGYNDRRPLVLHEIQDTDFARLLSYLYVPWYVVRVLVSRIIVH